jgi:hypothetical protein
MARSLLPDPSKTLYYEKRGTGVVLNCQIRIAADNAMAVVVGDDPDVAKAFSEPDAHVKARQYIESLGYCAAEDWKLPPPTHA